MTHGTQVLSSAPRVGVPLNGTFAVTSFRNRSETGGDRHPPSIMVAPLFDSKSVSSAAPPNAPSVL